MLLGRKHRHGLLGRFRRNREGAVAVEMAFVAIPFFLILFAIIELALVFVTDTLLDHATNEAGRMVRTGQADAESMDAAAFKNAICDQMSVMSAGCLQRVTIDVRPISQFDEKPPEPEQADDLRDSYNGGSPGSLMLVRVWYRQPVITPLMDQAIARIGDNRATLLRTTTAFKNEPFTQTSNQAGGG